MPSQVPNIGNGLSLVASPRRMIKAVGGAATRLGNGVSGMASLRRRASRAVDASPISFTAISSENVYQPVTSRRIRWLRHGITTVRISLPTTCISTVSGTGNGNSPSRGIAGAAVGMGRVTRSAGVPGIVMASRHMTGA